MKQILIRSGSGLVFALMMLSGCAGTPNRSAAPAGHEALALTVWTVPQTTMRVHVQVRLSPRREIAAATLDASTTSPSLIISPSGFSLTHLTPPHFNSPGHNPPELGQTVIRTFVVSAATDGHYQVKISLQYGHVTQMRTIDLIFPVDVN